MKEKHTEWNIDNTAVCESVKKKREKQKKREKEGRERNLAEQRESHWSNGVIESEGEIEVCFKEQETDRKHLTHMISIKAFATCL